MVLLEKSGGVVLESITDNFMVNWQFCKVFNRTDDIRLFIVCITCTVCFVLFDTVHLL